MFASSGANGVLWTTITIAIVVVILAAVTYAMSRPFSHRHCHHQRVPPPHLYHERTDL